MDDTICCLNPLFQASPSRRLDTRVSIPAKSWALLFSLALLMATTFAPTSAYATPQTKYEFSSAQHAITQGNQLETKGAWAEALTLYQQALRDYPNHDPLKTRRSVARIHYDLDRRYADSSFVSTIRQTSGSIAGSVYAEVLLKIESFYVDQPNWAELASYGLTSLEVALLSPEFRQVNQLKLSDAQIRQTIIDLRKRLETARVNNRNDAYLVAVDTGQYLGNKIGLASQATIYEFVCGAISALDPYSAFMSSSQYSETMSQIEGNFVGLGVELRTHSDHLEIVNVIRGGSADQGGIVDGDRIVAVDHYTVAKYGSERVADMMRGVEGSKVAITVDRGLGPVVVNLERRRVEIPSVDQVGLVDSNYGVAYIKLTNFQKTTARDFDAAMRSLAREGMQSLIVDVRGNPGGLLSASVEVADRFVNEGVIVSTKGRNPMEDFVHHANISNTWRIPLVVLVDENSASASEIFAAAIRDHKRGIIVGEKSYGKGSVQGIFPLNVSGGGVRLTTAKFFSPTGKPINQVGVKADVAVQRVAKATAVSGTVGEDQVLRVGVQTARRISDQRKISARPSQPGTKPQFAGR